MIKGFSLFLSEAGSVAQTGGKLEIVKTPLNKARAYAEKMFAEQGLNLDDEIPNFDNNYQIAQKRASLGKTKRADMPVINSDDVRDLQYRLKHGFLDVKKPHNTLFSNPFPDGLTGADAHKWLEGGLPIYDGDKKDDKIKVKTKKISADILVPIQQQIYFDKAIQAIIRRGAARQTHHITDGSSFLIVGKDGSILDGHHRYLSALLINPKMSIQCMVIDLPIKKLLPLTQSYTDAVGNQRNL